MKIIRTIQTSDGVIPIEQGSADWFGLRVGIPTASEFKNLVTDKFKIREWSTEMPKTYLFTKLAEKWRGLPLADFTAWDTEQGKIRELFAIPAYELEFSETVDRVPFITTDDGLIGCSPDGLIGETIGLEVKCLQPQNHLKILMTGQMPDDYAAQVHGSMLVTGFDCWKFMSFCPGFPTFVTTIERDETIQVTLKSALEGFLERLKANWERLVKMNGGLPKYLSKASKETVSELEDILV